MVHWEKIAIFVIDSKKSDSMKQIHLLLAALVLILASYNSEYYGLDGEGEARAYLAHPILGQRLRDICEVLLEHAGKRDIDYIMGSGIDVLKLQTSMNLFNSVCPDDVFQKVLEAFF